MAKKYLSEQIEKAVIDELNSNTWRRKVDKAFENAEKRCNRDIQKAIKKMVGTYYSDYTPFVYQRTNQLKKSLAPYTELIISTQQYDYKLGTTVTDPIGNPLFMKMDHSKYDIKMTYKKKNGQISHYTYSIKLPNGFHNKFAREEKIADNLWDNIHGSNPVFETKGSHDLRELITKEISSILNTKLVKYVQEELSKI